MGEVGEVRWSWVSAENKILAGRVDVQGKISVSDLVAAIQEITPGVTADRILINYSTASWERPATPEEIAEFEERRAQAEARKERWERETYERLKAKYES